MAGGRAPPVGGSGQAGSGGNLAGAAGGVTGGSGGTSKSTARTTLQPNKVMTCEAPGLAVATQRIEAECAFGSTTGNCKGTTGAQQGTQLENANTTVGYIEGGDFLSYSGVAMDSIDKLQFHYAKGVDGGKIEVHVDTAAGQLIGTWAPVSTGGWTTWSDATVTLSQVTGSHALCLVAVGSTGGIVSLDWIQFSAGGVSADAAVAFHINQLGFDTLGPKHAVVEGPATLTRFFVVGSDGVAVWCGGMLAESFSAWGSNKSYYSLDFTELTRPGTYQLQTGSSASAKFQVSDNRLLAQTFASVLGYFTASRADDPDVWSADASIPFFGSDARADVRGGWYDASGDISKYLSHLSYANFMNPQQIPL
ncbi:MAG TPA: carbohydrate-binding protein, partial [Polyangia bacterium]|nr:carbohydrate-binding protein [Polyangia bacterium]